MGGSHVLQKWPKVTLRTWCALILAMQVATRASAAGNPLVQTNSATIGEGSGRWWNWLVHLPTATYPLFDEGRFSLLLLTYPTEVPRPCARASRPMLILSRRDNCHSRSVPPSKNVEIAGCRSFAFASTSLGSQAT